MTTITNLQIKQIVNGYVLTLRRTDSNPAPMTPPEEYAFPTWEEVTAWLITEQFVPAQQGS